MTKTSTAAPPQYSPDARSVIDRLRDEVAMHAAMRVGGAVAYVNSLIKDLHAGGYTVIVSEKREVSKSIGMPDPRVLSTICVRLYEPGETVEGRAEDLDL